MKLSKINLLLIASTIVLAILLLDNCGKSRDIRGLNDTLKDSLRIYIDRDGLNNASISVFRSDNKRLFLKMKSKDSTVEWLQDVAKDYKGRLNSAIVLANSTGSEGVEVTSVIGMDTIRRDSLIYVYPKYKASWESRWELGVIEASRDSVRRSIKVKNEYEITIGKKSNGWFKKRLYEVNIKNINPNTFTRELRSFEVKSKTKRINLGLSVGYGIDLVRFKPVIYFGIGLNYNLMGIK